MKRFMALLMTMVMMFGMSGINAWADEAKWQIEATSTSLYRECGCWQ